MGNCLSCFKVPPPSSAPQNSASSDAKPEMPELESLYCEASPPYVPTEITRHNNSNTINIYSVPQTNGNAANVHLKQPMPTLMSTCSQLSTATTATLTSSSVPSRSFYTRKTAPLRTTMGQSDSKHASDSKLNALFDHYKDASEDTILADGIERFCDDLQVSPDEFRVLILAWKLNAEQMCRFTRQEFVQGCKNMRADSVRSIQIRLPELVTQVEKDMELFKDLYRFTFRFGLDVVTGQRILPADMAICLWRLVFSVREPPILHRWLRFLEEHPHVRGIPRDTWNMFLNFSEAVGDDLSCYDDTEAWPSLFDDFVEYENDQMNQNISKEKDCEDKKVISLDD